MILTFLFDEEEWTVERAFSQLENGRHYVYLNMQAIP
jgi:hypothetical protein